jgi:hypothetical protein
MISIRILLDYKIREMKKKQGKQKPIHKERPKSNFQDIKPTREEDDKGSFDFGGLPQRDIKKNLGCG